MSGSVNIGDSQHSLFQTIGKILTVGCLLSSSFSALSDQQFTDDVIVKGSICVGTDCNTGESFNFDTIRMKENNLRIRFQDTSTSSSFPTRDWELTVNESANGGKNQFYIQNLDAPSIPFVILEGARENALYVGSSSSGNYIGMGTTAAAQNLHIKDGNSPGIRLEQDGSSGFAAQSWDIGGNETGFFVRDATNNSKLPLRIRTGAPSASIYVDVDGDIGFETTSPDGMLDIAHPSDMNNHAVLLSSTANFGINIDNGFVPNALFEVQRTGGVSNFAIESDGDVGVGTATPTNRFDVKNKANDNTIFTILDAGYAAINAATTNAYYGLTAQLDVHGATGQHATVGINSPTDSLVASLSFAGAGTPKWLLSSRNALDDGGSTADRLAIYSKSVNEVFTIHQNGAVYFGNSPGTTNNTVHAIEVASGAHLTVGGVWTDASSRDLKDNIIDLSLDLALNALQKLNPVTFSYKRQPNEEYVGFIAEEVPDLVATGDRKGLASMDVVGVLTKVVQNQQETIEQLTERLNKLEAEKSQYSPKGH